MAGDTQQFNTVFTFETVNKSMVDGFNKINRSMKKLTDQIGDLGKRMDKSLNLRQRNSDAKAFNVTMLSTLFFAKAMSQVLIGLINPAMEVFGIFDLWGSVLTVVFIPIMEILMPYFIKLMEWFMNLPEPVKIFIGALTLLGIGFFKVLEVIAIFSLAFKGLSIAMMGTVGIWLLVAGAIVAAGWFIYTQWDKIVGGFKVIIQWFKQMLFGLAKWVVDWAIKFGKFFGITSDTLQSWSDFLAKGIEDSNDELSKIADTWGKSAEEGVKKTTQIVEEGGNDMVDSTQKNYSSMYDSQTNFQNKSLTSTQSYVNTQEKLYSSMYDVVDKASSKSKAITGSNVYGNASSGLSGYKIGQTIAPGITYLGTSKTSYSHTSSNGSMSPGGFSTMSGGSASMGHFNDFIYRPGKGISTFSPNDTVVGVKDTSKLGGSGMNVNITYNINVSDKQEMMRMMDMNNKKLAEDVKRMVKL